MFFADVAELADAPDLGSGGRPYGFKSLIAHHINEQHRQLLFSFYQIPGARAAAAITFYNCKTLVKTSEKSVNSRLRYYIILITMKKALIDIGSNSMRLTVYEIRGSEFRPLFKQKIIAGLAGYVSHGSLTEDGIRRAYEGILDFKRTLELLEIDDVSVFATASLRNIGNTDEAVTAIKSATGFDVDVISGEEEAYLGYIGAMSSVRVNSGVCTDIGGASSEAVIFENGRVIKSASFPVGSLSLFKSCVKNIIPGNGSIRRMRGEIMKAIPKEALESLEIRSPLIGIGGTARAVRALAAAYLGLPDDVETITIEQFDRLYSFLCGGTADVADLILAVNPERIHTAVPGAMILHWFCELFRTDEIIVSSCGVREGYLCKRIISREKTNTDTLRTGN